ncbi:MAG: ATP cone domain-containing protein [Candidatus Paceibacterota bacterium]
MPQQIKIINSLGKEEPFSERKVLRSLKRAGANHRIAASVLNRVQARLFDKITTSEIFKIVRQELNKEQPVSALRFNLKQAMRNLGPDGFSFEKYVKQILEEYGFSVDIDRYISGRCMSYETDIIAENDKLIYFGECKYRNQPGERIDLGVCMKLFAASTDACPIHFKNEIKAGKKVIPLIVTNAKFTNQAIKYCECQGIKLLGWNYPKGNGLEKMVENKQLYPITILPSFKQYMNQPFGGAGVMLAKQLVNIKNINNFSKKVGLPLSSVISLSREAKMLLESDIPIVKN